MSVVKPGNIRYANPEGDLLVLGTSTDITTMDEARNFTSYPHSNRFTWASRDGTGFWASNNYEGLRRLTVQEGNSLHADSLGIVPDSPVRNYCYYLDLTDGQRLLVGGGRLNYQGKTYEGTVMYMQDGRWTNFPEDSIPLKTGLAFR